MKRLCAALLAVSLISLFPACEGKKTSAQKTGISVVTTNFPPYDFVRAIAGNDAKINISMLLPPGSESHSFEPTPQDIITIQDCDVFIYTGGENDVWVDRILQSIDTSNIKIVRMMDEVAVVEEVIVEGMEDDEDHGHDHEHGHEEAVVYDEHVWTSPKNAVSIVRGITDVLCEIDTENAALLRENSDAFCAELGELDKQFQAVVDGAKRKIIVFGDRFPFRYFADAYGLTYFAAFPGCSTDTEPSAATVAFLINKIREEKIPVVFHIELSNERMADTIAEETGAKKLLLHACHNITKKDFDSGVTFLEIQLANVPRLKEALW